MTTRTTLLGLGFVCLAWLPCHADNELENKEQPVRIEEYVQKLDRINFLPTLLPTIIDNRDVIELTDQQVERLLAWREKNREDVIAVMNEIARKRAGIREAAISPAVSSARIKQMQTEIFRLQRQVLEYKLSCRELVMDTFNRRNWEGFFFVLADHEMGIALPEVHATR